jgi:uncharacterized protein YbaR (Trm112 family)
MRQQFEQAGFQIKNTRALSHFRINLLKRLLPTSLLVTLDSWAQPTGNWWQFTPSLFVQAEAQKPFAPRLTDFFSCPVCYSPRLVRTQSYHEATPIEALVCQDCQRHWSFKNGIYDFKTPLNAIP